MFQVGTAVRSYGRVGGCAVLVLCHSALPSVWTAGAEKHGGADRARLELALCPSRNPLNFSPSAVRALPTVARMSWSLRVNMMPRTARPTTSLSDPAIRLMLGRAARELCAKPIAIP